MAAVLAVGAFVWLLATPAWGIKFKRAAVVSGEDGTTIGSAATCCGTGQHMPVSTLDELNRSLSAQMGELRRLVRESNSNADDQKGGAVPATDAAVPAVAKAQAARIASGGS